MFNNNIGKFPSFNKNNNNNSSYINSTVSILSNFYSNPLLILDHIHPVIHCYHHNYDITCDKCTQKKNVVFVVPIVIMIYVMNVLKIMNFIK